MGHEISQFDIHDRQLLAGMPQPSAGIVTDVGEAKITHTIFGRAKVRVVRVQDRKRRVWLLAILIVTATAAAAWQGWIISRKNEYVAPPVSLSERILVSAPVFLPAHIIPDPHPSRRRSESLIQTEIDGLLSGPLPRHPPGWKPPAKPVTAKPSMANQAPATAQAQTTAQIQVPAQTRTTPQPATTVPAAAVPIANPLVKREASIPSPAGSVPHPVSAQD